MYVQNLLLGRIVAISPMQGIMKATSEKTKATMINESFIFTPITINVSVSDIIRLT